MHILSNHRAILIIIVVLVITIPTGTFLLSKRFNFKGLPSSLNLKTSTSPKEVPKDSPIKDLQKSLDQLSSGDSSSAASSGAEVFFGPTMNFSLSIEGRPKSNQAAKIFLGISQGQPVNKPQYLLSFSVDVPPSGTYTNLSIAGLNQDQTYTAYVKGPSQIATASAFVLKTTVNNLGTFNLTTGDLNEDNIINSSDYAIAKVALGATSGSEKWNANVDFNLDGVINNFDLAFIIKNFGKTGVSGTWYSPISSPKPASQSGTLQQLNVGSEMSYQKQSSATGSPGYWLWIPKN